MRAEILCEGKRQSIEIAKEMSTGVLRDADKHCYWLYWTNVSGQPDLGWQDVIKIEIHLTDAEFGQLATKIAEEEEWKHFADPNL